MDIKKVQITNYSGGLSFNGPPAFYCGRADENSDEPGVPKKLTEEEMYELLELAKHGAMLKELGISVDNDGRISIIAQGWR